MTGADGGRERVSRTRARGDTRKKVTLVWDYHGSGRLVGIFDDQKTIQLLRELVAESQEESYVRFSEVKVNEIVSTSFHRHPGGGR